MFLMLTKGILKPIIHRLQLGTKCVSLIEILRKYVDRQQTDCSRGVTLWVIGSFIFLHFQNFNYVLTLHLKNFFLLLFNYSCVPFLPIPPPQLNPPPSPTSSLPLDFVHVTFIVVPVIPSPHCPLPTPPWRLLDCS